MTTATARQTIRSAETIRRVARQEERGSWWERWRLAVAAIGCWTFLALALIG
ncbi:MAG: hypothetical protein R2839_08250 [Thermomicrobiales bacterium]